MVWARHVIVLLLAVAVAYFPLRYFTTSGPFAAFEGFMVLLAFTALLSLSAFVATRSFVLTSLYSLAFSELLQVLDGIGFTFFLVNLAPVYFIVLVTAFLISSFLRGGLYDPVITKLRRKRFSFKPLVVGLIASGAVLLAFKNYFLFLGSLVTAFSSSLDYAWYYGLYSLASWLTLPLSLDEEGQTRREGACLGEVEAELVRTRLARRSYVEWIGRKERFCVDFSELDNYNVVVVGSSGSGKSTLVKHLLSQLEGIDYLVIDPHGEHGDLGEVVDASRVSINPLSLFGASPHQRSVEVASMLKSVFNLGPLQEITLTNLLVEAYAFKGITDDPSTWSNEPPTFRDLLSILEREKKLATDSQALGRLSSLEPYLKFLNEAIFHGSGIPLESLFKGKKVLDLSKVNTREIAYIVVETVLRGALYSLREKNKELRNLVVIDEAPFVLEKESGQFVVDRLASEGRKFGFGLVLVSQYVKPLKKVIPNTSLQVFMRLVSPEDLNYVSSLLSPGDEETKRAIVDRLTTLGRGEFIARDLRAGRVVVVYTPGGSR